MKIKKFVISNIILSIVLISALYGLSWVYINYVNDRTVKFMEYNKLPDNSVDIVALGSSHGKYGIKFDKKNQINLGVEQQGMYYNWKILEKYERKIKNGATIIIPISIFSFFENNDYSKDETYKNYINLLDKSDIKKDLKNSEYFFCKNFSILYPPARIYETLNWLLECLANKKINKNRIAYGANFKEEEMKKNAIEAAVSHTISTKKEFAINGENALLNLLKYAETKNYKIIFINPPYWYEYIDELEKIEKNIFENKIYSNIKKVEKIKNKKYIFLDYTKNEKYTKNIIYFRDSNHLNEKGAEYFTKILLNDVEKELKDEGKI